MCWREHWTDHEGCRVMSGAVDLRERLERSLGEMQERGAAEICELLWETMRPSLDTEPSIRLETLKKEVYRLRLGSGQSLVLKRLKPATAQNDRLVVERWLPALGFGDRCPRLLGSAALRDGSWVWHVHEDLGHETLAVDRQPEHLAAAVGFIAELHTRSEGHPLLPEVRWRARDQGAHFFMASLRDAIATLETLTTPPREAPPTFARARERLLHQLHHLREDAARRVRAMEEAGPETLLHGDLWPRTSSCPRPTAFRARGSSTGTTSALAPSVSISLLSCTDPLRRNDCGCSITIAPLRSAPAGICLEPKS
jgi:hypothetical protein